jgi:hypothetical protein
VIFQTEYCIRSTYDCRIFQLSIYREIIDTFYTRLRICLFLCYPRCTRQQLSQIYLWVLNHFMNCGTSCNIRRVSKHSHHSTYKRTYRGDLLGHRTVDDEIGYTTPRGARSRHAPLRVAILQLHDALNAHVAAFGAVLFKQVQLLVTLAR